MSDVDSMIEGGGAPASAEALPSNPDIGRPSDLDIAVAEYWMPADKQLGTDNLAGIQTLANGPSTISPEAIAKLSALKAPEATAPASPEDTVATAPAATEVVPPEVVAAQDRIRKGENVGTADQNLVDRFNADRKQSKNLQVAREASANGDELSDAQKALIAADNEKRGNERVASKKAEIDELTLKKNADGTFDDVDDQVKYDTYMNEKARIEELMTRAAAGETLTDEELDALEEGKKVYDLEAESDDDEAVSESEEAKLERIQGQIDADTEAMLNEKDPDKRAEMLTKIAGQQAELMGMQLSASAKERDAKVIKEAFDGKRKKSESLFGSKEKKSARNERVQKLIDNMLADAAELQAVAQRMKAIDIARKQILDKVNSEKIRLGHRSTPMDKFIQVREVAPYYRQLVDLDDRMDDAKDAEYTFASRFYTNIRSIRAAVKARGVMMRIAESVAFTTLKFSAESAKYTRRASRTLTLQ